MAVELATQGRRDFSCRRRCPTYSSMNLGSVNLLNGWLVGDEEVLGVVTPGDAFVGVVLGLFLWPLDMIGMAGVQKVATVVKEVVASEGAVLKSSRLSTSMLP